MTDEELGQYIGRYGDRLALRAFCRKRTVTNEKSGGVETVKSALMQRVRDRLGEHRKTPANRDTEGSGIVGNKHAVKATRRVEMGWLHFDNGTYHQIKTRNGGGTRHLSVQKSVTMGELLETGKSLFFPNGFSSKGPVEDFEFDIRDYNHYAPVWPATCRARELEVGVNVHIALAMDGRESALPYLYVWECAPRYNTPASLSCLGAVLLSRFCQLLPLLCGGNSWWPSLQALSPTKGQVRPWAPHGHFSVRKVLRA